MTSHLNIRTLRVTVLTLADSSRTCVTWVLPSVFSFLSFGIRSALGESARMKKAKTPPAADAVVDIKDGHFQ